MSNELPLAAASVRLRRKPGRPRKPQSASVTGVAHPGTPRRTSSNSGAEASQASAPSANPLLARVPEASVPGLCPPLPRLLDLKATAQYLGVSPWTVRDLEAARALKRVSIPLPGGRELRKLLFDRVELDALVDAWKR
jgi:hypothetical protein